MRVAISADMEGISRLADPHEILAFSRPYWLTGRERMSADVVAAAVGLLSAGADEVVVLDNHGSGNPVNIVAEMLPSGARLETWNVFDLAEHGVDAMLQVGYHARAGVPAFISHTYVPGLWLRADGELIGESHGRTWAAGLPLLGIVGNEAHERTLGSLGDAPFLVVQRTSSRAEVEPVFTNDEEARMAIEGFAARVLSEGAPAPAVPGDVLFEASLAAGDEQDAQLAAAGWQRRTETEFAIELRSWSEARAPLAAAMAAALVPWMPYFTGFDLTSREAMETVHDDPVLQDGRMRFDAWLDQVQSEWLTPDELTDRVE
jgi:D-aminopeptidase